MGRLQKVILWLVLLSIFFVVTGFLVIPPVAKSIAVKKLSQSLHRDVAIEDIRFNPFTLCLTVQGFTVKERDSAEAFLSFNELFLNLEALSLAKRAVILKEVRLDKPSVRIVRRSDETYNFSDLLKKEAPAEEKKDEGPLHFSVNNIRLTGGTVNFQDDLKETKHTATDINIGLPFISNIAYYTEATVNPSLAATINGTPYKLEGHTKPFASSRDTEIDIAIRDLNIPYYLAYVPAKLNFKISSALLDADARLSFSQETKDKSSLAVQGTVTLKHVALDDLKGKPLLRLPSLGIDMASVKPLAGEIHLSKLFFENPAVSVERDGEGRINLLALIPNGGGESGKNNPPPKAGSNGNDAAKTTVDIDELLIEKGVVTFRDAVPAEPFNLLLEDIRLKAAGISTAAGKAGAVALSLLLPKKGTVTVEGPLSITPLSAKLAVAVKDSYLPAVQPYLSDAVNIELKGGKFSTDGELSLDWSEKGLTTRYTGKALVSRFAAIDRAKSEDLIKWGALYLNGIDVATNPLSVALQGISLSDFYALIVVNDDGTLNLQNLAVAGTDKEAEAAGAPPEEIQKTAEAPVEPAARRTIRIGTVTLQGGEIDLVDRYIKPSFSGKLVEIGGRVSGLSSLAETQADVDLRGRLDGYAPLEITGKINPLRDDLFVDIKAAFKDMDLSPVTPYSGKYIGYTIQKGKLSFDLKYLIAQRKLDSQNVIFIDQLTLGDTVESPQATKLPVSLAIALLKDRNGQIRLDIPVQGTLDDPEFSVWRIIVQVLINLVTKAATSPFALLGSLVGGGEELSFVDFEYGGSTVTEPNLAKLHTLEQALADRPSLQLEIEGYADAEKDREGMRDLLFTRKLKVQKMKEVSAKGDAETSVDEMVIEPAEYEEYLIRAYKAEDFPKPRNFLGIAKSLPVPEMEKLILTHLEVKDDDLRHLASQRALAVRDIILASGAVTPDRLFIIETSPLAPPEKENLKKSRVDFRLK